MGLKNTLNSLLVIVAAATAFILISLTITNFYPSGSIVVAASPNDVIINELMYNPNTGNQACGYDSSDSTTAISSIIITQREFTDANKAKSSYDLLLKVSKNTTKLSSTAYYDTEARQLVVIKGSILTTASIAVRDKDAFKSDIFRKLYAKL